MPKEKRSVCARCFWGIGAIPIVILLSLLVLAHLTDNWYAVEWTLRHPGMGDFLRYHQFEHPGFLRFNKKGEWVNHAKVSYKLSKKQKGEEAESTIFVVTGSTNGIGRALASQLQVEFGTHRVIHAVRKPELLPQLHERKLYLDLCSFQSIVEFVKNLEKQNEMQNPDTKYVLINNAGVAFMENTELTEDGFEKQYQTNYLGPFLLTRLMMEKKLLDRVVFVSSMMHRLGKLDDVKLESFGREAFFHTYFDTKLMQITMSNKLARLGIRSHAMNPGFCKTHLLHEKSMWDAGAEWISKKKGFSRDAGFGRSESSYECVV